MRESSSRRPASRDSESSASASRAGSPGGTRSPHRPKDTIGHLVHRGGDGGSPGGLGLEALREILGHRDIKMTLRYAHLSPGHMLDEIQRTAGPAPISTFSTHRAIIEPATARKSLKGRGSSVAEQLIRN